MSLQSAKILTAIIVVLAAIVFFQIFLIEKKDHDISEKKFQIEYLMMKQDSLYKRIDTLEADLFPCEVELNRYQIAYDILMSRNAPAARQYGEIMMMETE